MAGSGLIIPYFPLGFTSGPHFLQQVTVAQGIHGLPEAGMTVGDQLIIGCQLLQGAFFPHRFIGFNVIQYLWL